VLASDGTHLGWLDHVRDVRHADHPDEIIVRSRCLLMRRRRVPEMPGCGTSVWHEGQAARCAPGRTALVRREDARPADRRRASGLADMIRPSPRERIT